MIAIESQSQNCLGLSFRDTKEIVSNKGFQLNEGTTDDNIYYLTASDSHQIAFYYFNSNNVCMLYIYCVYESTLLGIENSLFNLGYIKSGSIYYNDKYQTQIIYDSDYKQYFIKTNFK